MKTYLIIFGIIIAAMLVLEAYLNTPTVKGRLGERALVKKLEKDIRRNPGGRILRNLYLPKENGETAETDVLYITRKGLLVFENKNFAGYIFGTEADKNWTVTLPAGKKIEKHRFYNPILQNRTHIKCLKAYLNKDIPAFSLVTFNDRGQLKNVKTTSEDVYVCKHGGLPRVLRGIWAKRPDVLDDAEIEAIYTALLPLTQVDRATKKEHVETIRDRFDSTVVCPVCGGELVLRTTKKGPNAGRRFYGCANYPKCRYVKDMEE